MDHDEALEHFGIKGMHWGVHKQRLTSDLKGKAGTTVRRVSKEYETGLAIAGVAALGVAYVHSPVAQKVMTVPVKATYHYMSKADNRRKVAKVLKKSYIVYSSL